MKAYVLPLLIGFFFGFLLQKAGMGHYRKIVNQFRLKDHTIMKFMMTAISVGLVGIFSLKDMNMISLDQIPTTYIAGNLAGGLLFGVGMAIAGACPGSIIAGGAQGNLDYLIPGVLGLLTGGILFGTTYETVFLKIAKIAAYGEQTLEDLAHVNHWLFIGLFVLCTLIFYVGSRIREDSTGKKTEDTASM